MIFKLNSSDCGQSYSSEAFVNERGAKVPLHYQEFKQFAENRDLQDNYHEIF